MENVDEVTTRGDVLIQSLLLRGPPREAWWQFLDCFSWKVIVKLPRPWDEYSTYKKYVLDVDVRAA